MKCLLCGSEKLSSMTHPQFHTLFHQCEECHVIFKDVSHFPSPEQEKKRYDEHHNDIAQEGYVSFLTNFIESAVTPFLSKGKMLDFGSGPAPVLAVLLQRLGFEVHTYDPFYQPNAIEEDSYDMITSTEVVEHLHAPMRVFEWMDLHTKAKGYIAIMTHFYPKEQHRYFGWFYQRDVSHVIFYAKETWLWLAKHMGWDIVMCDDRRIVVFQKKSFESRD
jgi:hypothetical protein